MDGATILSFPPAPTTAVSSTVSGSSTSVESAVSAPSRKRRVIPLVHSQRLRKHSALIHTPTPGLLLCCRPPPHSPRGYGESSSHRLSPAG